MKKILSVILILLLTINLFGCQSKETSAYNFEYKFKEEYSDKISPGLAGSFIDIIKDVVEIYDTALDDLIIQGSEEVFDDYALSVCLVYYERQDKYNEDEKELIDIMTNLSYNSSSLYIIKTKYKKDEENKTIGIKPERTEEEYKEELKEVKSWLERDLEKAEKFIY